MTSPRNSGFSLGKISASTQPQKSFQISEFRGWRKRVIYSVNHSFSSSDGGVWACWGYPCTGGWKHGAISDNNYLDFHWTTYKACLGLSRFFIFLFSFIGQHTKPVWGCFILGVSCFHFLVSGVRPLKKSMLPLRRKFAYW